MATIATLPVELISTIFDYSTLATLANAARCSRKWNDIAIPHLYRRIDVITYPNLKLLTALFLHKPDLARWVRHFSLRTTLDKSFLDPALAVPGFDDPWVETDGPSYMSEHDTDGDSNMSDECDGQQDIHTHHDIPIHSSHDSNVSEPDGPDNATDLSPGILTPSRLSVHLDTEASELWSAMNFTGPDEKPTTLLQKASSVESFLATLISCLPKVEILDLEVPGYPIYMERNLWRIAREGKGLRNLKSLVWIQDHRNHPDSYLTLSGIHGPTPQEEILEQQWATAPGYLCAGIFALPAIQSIYLLRVGSVHDHLGYKKLASLGPRTSNCTHLELRSCILNATDIRHMIAIPRVLKSFIFEFGGLLPTSVDLPSLVQNLTMHKDSLEQLVLEINHFCTSLWDNYRTDNNPIKCLSPLKQFTKLTRIKLAALFVVEYYNLPTQYADHEYPPVLDFLPPAIETVRFTHTPAPGHEALLWKALRQLLLHKHTRVPNLRTITFEVEDKRSWRASKLAELAAFARELGVEITLLDVGPRKPVLGTGAQRKWGFDEDVEWSPSVFCIDRRPEAKPVHL